MLGCFRSGGTFETHIGNNGRNAAALEKPFFRLEAREGRLDDFDGSGGYIVFRAQGDDGAAAMKNVSNELESRGAHQAVGIDAKCDVVNNFATMHGFRNHELLVFSPGKSRGQLRRLNASLISGNGLL